MEEWINDQHELIKNLYPNSVNPIRLITVLYNNECKFLVGGLTIGNRNNISNASCGDMVAPIDLESGFIKYDAEDLEGITYSHHPTTNVKIAGVKIPYWEDILSLISEASKVVPDVGYVGWDIAVTQEGPLIIEDNTSPGYKFYQLKRLNHKFCGMVDSLRTLCDSYRIT